MESKSPKALACTVAKKMRAAHHNPDALAAEAILEGSPGAWPRATLAPPEACGATVRDPHRHPARRATHAGPKLRSTNAVESMIEICRDPLEGNVQRWRDGQMH